MRITAVTTLVLGLLAVPFVLDAQQASDQNPESREKLTGHELRRFATTPAVYAGVNHENDCAFMIVVYPGGPREQFWTCALQSGTSGPGTIHVTWDEICSKYERMFGGEPYCLQYYRIGPDKYEGWRDGKHVVTFSKVK